MMQNLKPDFGEQVGFTLFYLCLPVPSRSCFVIPCPRDTIHYHKSFPFKTWSQFSFSKTSISVVCSCFTLKKHFNYRLCNYDSLQKQTGQSHIWHCTDENSMARDIFGNLHIFLYSLRRSADCLTKKNVCLSWNTIPSSFLEARSFLLEKQ